MQITEVYVSLSPRMCQSRLRPTAATMPQTCHQILHELPEAAAERFVLPLTPRERTEG